ncbi:MAG: hypothetical protein FD169_2453 [Bacillota bacterium]|nr:MAG: hypothetical protein FD169_2453 [Bacillota bacterium]MBS3949376.1 hypothetical protein [Peptococcaceae bacterium]
MNLGIDEGETKQLLSPHPDREGQSPLVSLSYIGLFGAKQLPVRSTKARAGINNMEQKIDRGQGEYTMPNINPKETVSRGYNKVSHAYREADYDIANSPYKVWLAELTSRLNKGDRLLDLGCGCGVPVAYILAEQFAVDGGGYIPACY